MKVAIAGGHGRIALRLTQLLREQGDEVRSLIRNPDHAGGVGEAGPEPVLCDLEAASEDEVAEAIGSVDAVVFAAGAGPGSGPERKESMDYGGAVKLIAAAKAKHIDRYLIVSSMGADPSAAGDETFSVYLRAKGKADEALRASGLRSTIVRPGSLTDEAGVGRVRIGEGLGRGSISRDDVAEVLAVALHSDSTVGKTFEVFQGDVPVAEALASI